MEELESVTPEKIQTLIYEIRGFQVMLVLFIIKNENLMADEKSCNSMLYIEESRLV